MKNYTASIFFLAAVLTSLLAFGQQENRTRTRTVDYAEYDRLTTNIAYAKDKIKAANALLNFVDQNFTVEDEEYYSARETVVSYIEQGGQVMRAIELIQQAVQAHEKNYPFYNRGYAIVTQESLYRTYLQISRLQTKQMLYEKNYKFLESKRTVLEGNDAYDIRQGFYRELGNTLVGLERYEEAIQAGLKLKELTESGALKMNFQTSDEIFKIDPSWPQETKEQMQKAKENYEKTIETSQAAILSSNRNAYSQILSTAYFNSFQFVEAIPYAKGLADEIERSFKLLKSTLEDAQQQYKDSPYLADSIKQQMTESFRYTTQMSQLGGVSSYLIIAACKTNQIELASQYAKGLIDKALLKQLTNNLAESERYYQQAFELLRSITSYKFNTLSYEQWRMFYLPFYLNLQVQKSNLIAAHEEVKEILQNEERHLKSSFQFFSESEKKEFFKGYSTKLDDYYSLLVLMTEKGDDRTGELLNKILQTKGLILDATREQERQLRKLNDRVALAQLAEIRRLRDKLTAFYQVSAKAPTSALTDSINRTAIRVADLERAVNMKLGTSDLLKPVRWQDVQARLKQGEVYLEILRLQRETFAFDKPKIQYFGIAIKPGDSKPTLLPLGDGESMDGRGLKNYQNRIRSQMEDTDSYKLYWEGIADLVKGSATVYLSADGAYHVINPFTLQQNQSGKFLLDNLVLKRVSSGRDLLATTTSLVTSPSLALIGNPNFDMKRKTGANQFQGNELQPVEAMEMTRSGFAQLPGTQREIDLIGELALSHGFKPEILASVMANESNVKELENPQVLHLATHGVFDQLSRVDTYLKSKLILAGAADEESFSIDDYALYEDGFLTAYEVTQLNLEQTQLVVLSACETGLGEIQSGEGVWGLQRAFQLAGAKTVMGSLWKISDEATVIFMEAFYKEYLGKKDVYQAYQAAMVATRTHYPHPYYWGAFTLVGAN